LEIKVGDRVEFRKDNYVTEGTIEAVLYVGGTKARVVTDEGARITLPARDFKVLKETA
tara:strand:- start:835 stop:1008 length:174 start_codon:yes stop_codon:yes gene_type:complete